uniref:MFS domain-containing protein n=1 Tax=Caenorhabditis tropicalis TaxID=1561998 RepID=A0A1I7TP74_9PELO
MKDDPSGIRKSQNGTEYNIYDYSTDEKAAIIWAVAFGTLLGTLPYNWFYVKFGARFTFLSAGMLSFVSTVLIPTMVSTNFYLLLVIRFFQGIAYAADFAVIGIICMKWAPLDENAFFVSALTIFSPFATSITDSLTGWVSDLLK